MFFTWIPLKIQKTSSLKRQHSFVAFCKHTVFAARNSKFRAVGAFKLKGYVVGCRRVRVMMFVSVTAMAVDVCPFARNFCFYGETGRLLIFTPRADSFKNRK